MQQPDIISSTHILRENRIPSFLYCAEIGGACDHEISYKRDRNWFYAVICNRGSFSVTIKDEIFTVRRGFMTVSNNCSPTLFSSRKDFHGYLCGIDFNTFLDSLRGRGGIPMRYGEDFRSHNELSDADSPAIRTLSKDCRNLLKALEDDTHHLTREKCYANFFILLSDIVNLLWNAKGKRQERREKPDRGDQIVRRFMEEASRNIEKESKVEFYAQKLYLSKQHLSEVILKKTGHTIGSVLSTFRYEWSMRYINDPKMTLQQVASQMSFPDQSSFGKFFRKHSGISPARYRKNHGIL